MVAIQASEIGEGWCRALIAGCSKRNRHQVTGLPISNRWGLWLLGTQIGCCICFLIRHLFIHGFYSPSTVDSSYMPADIVLGVRRKQKWLRQGLCSRHLTSSLLSSRSHSQRRLHRAARCLWVTSAAQVGSYCSHVGWCPLPMFCRESQWAVGPEWGLDGLPSRCQIAHSRSQV